jgi:ribose transport system substrate-binding protein
MKIRKILPVAAGAAAVVLAVSACGGSSGGGSGSGDSGKVTHVAGAPDWCGTKKISFALLDGFGGNSWRLVTTASGKEEAMKCPSVTKFSYADGQGDTQKAISDIKSLASSGVNAMVVFPDAGKAVLPALTSAYKAGVVTVPYRVDPGGKAGTNYD